MKKLPIGDSSFSAIVEDNLLYVDKTKKIYELISKGKKYFLSRPRRFGKSLTISTLEAIWNGRKELFKGLWIEKSDWTWEKYPVMRLDMSGGDSRVREILERSIKFDLKVVADKYEVSLNQELPLADTLKELILNVYKKYNQKVVILIDEYDKPIIEHLTKENLHIAKENREILKNFYGVIKIMDEYVRFVFMTGVSKFSKVGVFSGLNNLSDITMNPQYGDLVGLTQEELESNFDEYINELAKVEELDKEQTLDKIRDWYNGFRFSKGDVTVYNPYSTLLLFGSYNFENYWFSSGTPTFLINLIKDNNYDFSKMDSFESNSKIFDSYEIEDLNIQALLYQTGYVTIKDYVASFNSYILGYPNREVRISFSEHLIEIASGVRRENLATPIRELVLSLRSSEMDKFFKVLKVFFANVPQDIQLTNEKYYQTIFYVLFLLIGIHVKAEVQTGDGRIDAVIKANEKIYLFEFKLNDTAESALKQIRDKEYFKKYLLEKDVKLVGVEFSKETKNIGRWLVEEV